MALEAFGISLNDLVGGNILEAAVNVMSILFYEVCEVRNVGKFVLDSCSTEIFEDMADYTFNFSQPTTV